MKQRLVPIKSAFMLLCSIIPLAACSPASMPSWMRSITGNENYERDANNAVRGAKHAPAFNPKSGGGRAMAKPAGAMPSLENNPFDYFDLNGNPVTPQAVAPAPAAQADPAMPVPAAPLAPIEPPKSSLTPLIPPPVPAEEQKPGVMDKSGSWFDRTFGMSEREQGQDAAYPELSSVPPPPDALRDIKAERQQNMESLQQEHKQAEEQRQSADSEPAQTAPGK